MVSPKCFPSCGVPLVWFNSPGIVVEAAKATVAISAATTEQDSEVLFNQLPPSSTNFSWVSSKISSGVLPLWLS